MEKPQKTGERRGEMKVRGEERCLLPRLVATTLCSFSPISHPAYKTREKYLTIVYGAITIDIIRYLV